MYEEVWGLYGIITVQNYFNIGCMDDFLNVFWCFYLKFGDAIYNHKVLKVPLNVCQTDHKNSTFLPHLFIYLFQTTFYNNNINNYVHIFTYKSLTNILHWITKQELVLCVFGKCSIRFIRLNGLSIEVLPICSTKGWMADIHYFSNQT